MKKKLLKLPVVAAVCLTLSGCSFSIPGFGAGASSALDVVTKYNELMEESSNYHADMEMEFGICAKGDGMTIDLPVKMGLSVDVLDKNMHGNMDMSMSFWGEEMEDSMEVYVESGRRNTTTYSYSDTDGYWTVTEDSGSAAVAFSFQELDASGFENAEMEYDKDKGIYTITQSLVDFADSCPVYDMLEDTYSGMAEMASVDSDDLLDEWEDAKITYEFDKDFYLLSVVIDGCEYSGTVSEDGTEVDIDVSFEFSFEFSDYGKIEESDVEVPAKVADSAVPSVTINADDADMDINVNINDFEYDNGYDIPDYEEEDPVSIPEGDGLEENEAGLDTVGSYNGVSLTGEGDSWRDTFGADGWKFSCKDGEYNFMTASNEKYKDAELYVYNAERTGTTSSDILEDGVYGYDINCTYSSATPDMTWGGLTFGASADDIIFKYGQPDFTYDGTMYTTYEYDIMDDIELTFYVYQDGGLKRVNVAYYNF